jgi:hypothetical protein
MSETRQKLLEESERKTLRHKEARANANSNKTTEGVIFDFFRNIEQARQIHNNEFYDKVVFKEAWRSMRDRLKSIDHKVNLKIEWNIDKDDIDWQHNTVRGVTISWSAIYLKDKDIYPILYIDVGQMLFI